MPHYSHDLLDTISRSSIEYGTAVGVEIRHGQRYAGRDINIETSLTLMFARQIVHLYLV